MLDAVPFSPSLGIILYLECQIWRGTGCDVYERENLFPLRLSLNISNTTDAREYSCWSGVVKITKEKKISLNESLGKNRVGFNIISN